MLKKYLLGAVVLAGLGLSTLANAEQPTDTRFYVAPLASYDFSNENTFDPEDQLGGQLSFGKTLNKYLALEIYGFYFDDVDAKRGLGPKANIDVYGYGLSALVFPMRDIFPVFGVVGVGRGQHDFDQRTSGPAGLNKQDSNFIDVGVGFLVPINDYGVAIRGEYRYRTSDVDAPGGGEYKFRDNVVSLGLQIPLGSKPEAATPPPAPVQARDEDSDGDGVLDSHDQCPGTLPGTEVDDTGCPVQQAAPIILKGVTFDFDSARLTANASRHLNDVIDTLQANPNPNVRIDGYTDSLGHKSYNQQLSQERAASVKRYLVDHGVKGERLSTKGFGESNPVAPNTKPDGSDNPAGRAQNRRVEMHVTE